MSFFCTTVFVKKLTYKNKKQTCFIHLELFKDVLFSSSLNLYKCKALKNIFIFLISKSQNILSKYILNNFLGT